MTGRAKSHFSFDLKGKRVKRAWVSFLFQKTPTRTVTCDSVFICTVEEMLYIPEEGKKGLKQEAR